MTLLTPQQKDDLITAIIMLAALALLGAYLAQRPDDLDTAITMTECTRSGC